MKRLLLVFAVMFSASITTNSQVVYTNLEDNPVLINGINSEYHLNFFGEEAKFIIQNYNHYGEAIYFGCFTPGSSVVATPASYNANVNKLTLSSNISSDCVFYGYDDVQMPCFDVLYLSPDYSASEGSGINYVGVKFKNGNNTYYGWAEIENQQAKDVKLYGYAYQSTPNTPINAGQTGNLSLTENIVNKISIYPNPATDILNIDTKNAIRQICIINSLGQEVIRTYNTKQINISDLDNGVYFINVLSDNTLIKQKFIKR